MVMTPEDKEERKRQRLLATAIKVSARTYSRKTVAPLFQKMIRAEWATDMRRYLSAVVDGRIQQVERWPGQCVCVTCGKVDRWNSGIKGMHTGHFLASRCNSILFEETNVAPQCSECNYYRSGAQNEFRMWMVSVYGQEWVEQLEQKKRQSVSFTHEELVDMRMEYADRLKQAELVLKGCSS